MHEESTPLPIGARDEPVLFRMEGELVDSLASMEKHNRRAEVQKMKQEEQSSAGRKKNHGTLDSFLNVMTRETVLRNKIKITFIDKDNKSYGEYTGSDFDSNLLFEALEHCELSKREPLELEPYPKMIDLKDGKIVASENSNDLVVQRLLRDWRVRNSPIVSLSMSEQSEALNLEPKRSITPSQAIEAFRKEASFPSQYGRSNDYYINSNRWDAAKVTVRDVCVEHPNYALLLMEGSRDTIAKRSTKEAFRLDALFPELLDHGNESIRQEALNHPYIQARLEMDHWPWQESRGASPLSGKEFFERAMDNTEPKVRNQVLRHAIDLVLSQKPGEIGMSDIQKHLSSRGAEDVVLWMAKDERSSTTKMTIEGEKKVFESGRFTIDRSLRHVALEALSKSEKMDMQLAALNCITPNETDDFFKPQSFECKRVYAETPPYHIKSTTQVFPSVAEAFFGKLAKSEHAEVHRELGRMIKEPEFEKYFKDPSMRSVRGAITLFNKEPRGTARASAANTRGPGFLQHLLPFSLRSKEGKNPTGYGR